eukprot:4146768-Pleurochrysis_carterae.AAC.1
MRATSGDRGTRSRRTALEPEMVRGALLSWPVERDGGVAGSTVTKTSYSDAGSSREEGAVYLRGALRAPRGRRDGLDAPIVTKLARKDRRRGIGNCGGGGAAEMGHLDRGKDGHLFGFGTVKGG